jgi:hypothetical protein
MANSLMPGEHDWMKRLPGGVPGQQPGGFLGRMGGVLFPGAQGDDPQTTAAAQNQGLLMLGLGLMAAGSKPGATFGSSLFDAYQGASQNYAGAMDKAFRNTMLKRQADREERADERAEKRAEREERQQSSVTAGRLASGLKSNAADMPKYWQMVAGMPEVQGALQDLGLQVPTELDPESWQQFQGQLAQAGQIGGPVVPPRPLQLKAIVDPKTRKQILVPEELAVGQEPAYAPKGRGIQMTMPDGTTVEIGGDGGAIGPGELAKPTINALQETIVNSTNRLDRLNQTLSTYNPDFLRARGIASAATTKLKDFVGLPVSPEQRQYLSEYTEFQANAAQDLTQTLKELSGVAVNAAELKRAEKTAPSGTELSPTEFEAKSKATVKFVTRAIMRANWALKNGIGVKSVEDLSKAMPLEGIDAVYEQRANEIWQSLGGTPEMKAEAIKRANQEFGLAR